MTHAEDIARVMAPRSERKVAPPDAQGGGCYGLIHRKGQTRSCGGAPRLNALTCTRHAALEQLARECRT